MVKQQLRNYGFHSISFPNEWERRNARNQLRLNPVSIQLVFPTSGKVALLIAFILALLWGIVSIQLVFPTSGKVCRPVGGGGSCLLVSIQLVFPTSGKVKIVGHSPETMIMVKEFPFNQFSQRVGKMGIQLGFVSLVSCFHSISFPNEWERDQTEEVYQQFEESFHSISFPNEWESLFLG